MKTQEFLELLENHRQMFLQFEYLPGKRLRPDFHITEVKNVTVEATDCGGRTDTWKETVIQLWEAPHIEHAGPSITAGKALAILKRVHRAQPLMTESPLKFEYGNTSFHTCQMNVLGSVPEGDHLIIQLTNEATQCKAQELCGVATDAPAEEKDCVPGSGCC